MSYILKALKKLDEEKAAQKARPHDINRAILATDRKPRETARKPLIAVIVVLVLIVGSGTLYYLLKQRPQSASRPQDPAAVTASRVNQAQAPAPLPPTPTSDPEKKPAPGPPVAGQNLAVPAPSGKSPDASPPLPSRNPVKEPLPQSQRSRQEPSGTAPSGLKVNGIALQDDPAESVAVVNGILMRRGMTIQDMRLDEIFHDRVRFSGNGQRYEVYISK
jgi:general secretion pathway protein B